MYKRQTETIARGAAVSISHLHHAFTLGKQTVPVLENISLQLRPGESVALLGPSGCGKSTFARAIIGLVKATDGKVAWLGKDLLGMKPEEWREVRSDIQMIFQDPLASLNPRMTIGEIIAEPLRTYHPKMPRQEVRDRVKAMMMKVGLLPNLINRYPHEFSGGQQQRVAIGRALITKPKLILADEPTGNLDSKNSQDVIALLTQASRRYQQTILMITHNKDLTASVDRVFRVSDGVLTDLGGKTNEALS